MVDLIGLLRSPFVVDRFQRMVLPLLYMVFGANTLLYLLVGGFIGLDAAIYYRGSAAWLAGGDPWSTAAFVAGDPYHYAGLPPTTIALAPLTVLPEPVFVVAWMLLSLAAAVYILRRLHLPLWWLAFPPMVEGLVVGNPDIVMLALLVSGGAAARGLGAVLKVYAVVPLLGQRDRRAIIASAAVLVVTLLAMPLWSVYLSSAGVRSARLMAEALGGYNWKGDPALLAIGLVSILALARIDLKAAGWLAVPAIWPASQFHYATMALPVMHPILAVGLALPEPGVPVMVIAFYTVWRLLEPRLKRLDQAPRNWSERTAAVTFSAPPES